MTDQTYSQHMASPAFVVLSDTREVDQIVGSEREARREVKDLKAMGCDKAKWRRFDTWAEAYAYEDKCADQC